MYHSTARMLVYDLMDDGMSCWMLDWNYLELDNCSVYCSMRKDSTEPCKLSYLG